MGERKLAHVVMVSAVDPIPGYDRVELTTVLGWTTMTVKGQFKPYDLGIYIEIDSLVPATEPFKFMEKYHYRVTTQKFCKGTVLSQGLLMHPEDFGGEVVYYPDDSRGIRLNGKEYRLGDDMTEALGITYYSVDDRRRKRPSIDKYQAMALRHKKLFRRQPFKWLMEREWGKKLLFRFFGKKKDRRKAWPSWVTKTDEPRCLFGHTMIETENGKIILSEIVNKKLDVKVKSVNQDGQVEYKPITQYMKRKTNEELLEIEYTQRGLQARTNRIICTKDHRFYVDGGYVEAKDFKIGDYFTGVAKCLPIDCAQIVYGILLGDGGLCFDKRSSDRQKIKYSYAQGIEHKEYFEKLKSVMGCEKSNLGISGYTGKVSIEHFSFTDCRMDEFVKRDGCVIDRKFIVTESFANRLTPLSLAVWYMDDGSIRHNKETSPQNHAMILHTNAFSKEENEILINILRDNYGVEARLQRSKDKYWMIYLTVDGSKKFARIIAPYVVPCMRYKLPYDIEKEITYDDSLWPTCKKEDAFIKYEITDIKPYVKPQDRVVYDIEVADNHNFFANNVLCHNCQNMPEILKDKTEKWYATEKIDGTSTTFTMKRTKKWLLTEYDFRVCSRNVVMTTPDRDCYYDENVYWQMAKKYNVEEVLKKILDSDRYLSYVTIQGETYGNKIQARKYIDGVDFMAFNLIDGFDNGTSVRFNPVVMTNILKEYGIPCVPVVGMNLTLPDTVKEVMAYVDGDPSMIDGGMREGIVFRNSDATKSFKAVSNEYLIKYHNGDADYLESLMNIDDLTDEEEE